MGTLLSVPSAVTVTVDDDGEWVQGALTHELSVAFEAAGWGIEYKEQARELIIQSCIGQ